MSGTTYGPVELRIRWVEDDDFDAFYLSRLFGGDPEQAEMDAELAKAADEYGAYGCVIETRAPACGCCGRTDWEVAESLWGIVGDESYRVEIERELIAEVAA